MDGAFTDDNRTYCEQTTVEFSICFYFALIQSSRFVGEGKESGERNVQQLFDLKFTVCVNTSFSKHRLLRSVFLWAHRYVRIYLWLCDIIEESECTEKRSEQRKTKIKIDWNESVCRARPVLDLFKNELILIIFDCNWFMNSARENEKKNNNTHKSYKWFRSTNDFGEEHSNFCGVFVLLLFFIIFVWKL